MVHYFGNEYPATDKIEVFFDINDVEEPFKVIGQFTHENSTLFHGPNQIKTAMIKKAKEKGADGIIFEEVFVGRDFDNNERLYVKAKAIQYRK